MEEVAHIYLHNFEEYIQKCKNGKRIVSGLTRMDEVGSYFCRKCI